MPPCSMSTTIQENHPALWEVSDGPGRKAWQFSNTNSLQPKLGSLPNRTDHIAIRHPCRLPQIEVSRFLSLTFKMRKPATAPCCSMRGIVLLARTIVQGEVLRAVNGQRPARQMVGQRCSLGCPETLAQQHEVLLALGPAHFKLLPTHPSGFE